MFIKVALLLIISVVAIAQQPPINVDALLNNKEYFENQMKCVSKENISLCDRIGTRLKDKLLPSVAKTGSCEPTVCSDTDVQILGKSALKIQNEYPQFWGQLLTIYSVPPEIRDSVLKKEIAAVQPK
ncbi:hypothetical protein CHUAL_011084 [Chamberlinius hualienensis]